MSDQAKAKTQPAPPRWTVREPGGHPLASDRSRGQRIPEGAIVAGKYVVGDPIGRGAWSTVYAATQQAIGREVALKVAGGETGDPVLRERFAREARFLATIDHPNVVKVYEMGWLETGAAAIAMERLHGETMKQRLDKVGTMSVPVAFGIARQILDAIGAVHACSIVHRDLKPANVFLTEGASGPVPKLLDFGIGRDLNDGERLTAAGQMIGTPAFLAPEQLVSRDVDARADLYTIGVLLYAAITGKLPFVAPPARLVAMVLKDMPPAPSTLVPGIDRSVDALILKAVAKSPADRFQSADEMAAALG